MEENAQHLRQENLGSRTIILSARILSLCCVLYHVCGARNVEGWTRTSMNHQQPGFDYSMVWFVRWKITRFVVLDVRRVEITIWPSWGVSREIFRPRTDDLYVLSVWSIPASRSGSFRAGMLLICMICIICMICMICVIWLMLPGGNRITCMI